MPTLVIRSPDGSEQEHDVDRQLSIGRGEGNDLVLSEGGVSRKHARFFVESGALLVEDAGSANGTWVDGERIDGPTPIEAGHQIVIGDYEIEVKKNGKKALARAPREKDKARSTSVVPAIKPSTSTRKPARAAGPQLKGLNGAYTGKVFRLSDTMVIGRVGGSDIVLEDDSVSRKHAEIEVQGRQVLLRDLGSANGTTLNGEPLADETPLEAGDIIQFGVVEFMFETSAAAPERAMSRRADAPVARRRPPRDSLARSREPAPDEPSAPASKRRVIIAGVATVVFVSMIVAKAFLTTDPPSKKPLTSKPVVVDPADRVEALLTECRTYSSPETTTPDWSRARGACEQILEIEPIHVEANLQLKKIRIESACEENLNRGKELAAGGRFEPALDSFAKVGSVDGECPSYYIKALAASRDVVQEVKKAAGKECKEYSLNAKWENAYARCELYMRLACQMMEVAELYPPALSRIKLDGPLGPREWRPTDPLYINFLKARERVKPSEPMWKCPELRVFRPPPPPPDPGKAAKDEFAKRFADPDMGQALKFYFDGNSQARIPLQKIRESMSKASEHALAKQLLEDITSAESELDFGQSELANDKPDKAEAPFRRALAIDERLVLGERAAKMTDEQKRRELEARSSYVRRTIIESMTSKCYERGVYHADRKDVRAACRMWKLGASFGRSNTDLLKALTNVCTKRAGDLFDAAESCEQLTAVLEFAVDGDGYKQRVAERQVEDGCTSQ